MLNVGSCQFSMNHDLQELQGIVGELMAKEDSSSRKAKVKECLGKDLGEFTNAETLAATTEALKQANAVKQDPDTEAIYRKFMDGAIAEETLNRASLAADKTPNLLQLCDSVVEYSQAFVKKSLNDGPGAVLDAVKVARTAAKYCSEPLVVPADTAQHNAEVATPELHRKLQRPHQRDQGQ